MDVEITDKTEVMAEQSINGIGAHQWLGEMETLENWTDIIPGLRAKAESIVASVGDEKPEFAIVRVEEGWSNSGRLWDADCLKVIAEQINKLEPVGHLGHIAEEDLATMFPEPQTVWLGATTKVEKSKNPERMGEMVTALYAKGYLLPDAKIRTYIKTKAVQGVSWLGLGEDIRVPGQGVAVIADSFKLKALDWARKLSEGMPSSSVVAVVSEMEDNAVSEKALSQVTPDEFKKENPNGYMLLVSEAVAEKDTLITEMEEKVKGGEKAQDVLKQIAKALGIDEDADPLEAIVQMTKKLGEEAGRIVSAAVDKVLKAKVPDDESRALVKRLLPMAEMTDKIAEEKADDPEKVEKLISEMVDDSFDKDEQIQKFISEMDTSPVVRRREELRGGGEDGGSKGGKDKLDGNKYAHTERVMVS